MGIQPDGHRGVFGELASMVIICWYIEAIALGVRVLGEGTFS